MEGLEMVCVVCKRQPVMSTVINCKKLLYCCNIYQTKQCKHIRTSTLHTQPVMLTRTWGTRPRPRPRTQQARPRPRKKKIQGQGQGPNRQDQGQGHNKAKTKTSKNKLCSKPMPRMNINENNENRLADESTWTSKSDHPWNGNTTSRF